MSFGRMVHQINEKSAMNRDEGFLPSDYDYLIKMVRNRQGSSNSHEH